MGPTVLRTELIFGPLGRAHFFFHLHFMPEVVGLAIRDEVECVCIGNKVVNGRVYFTKTLLAVTQLRESTLKQMGPRPYGELSLSVY